MASVTPITEIRLLRGVRLTPAYQDTIYFADETQQETYFKSKTYVTLSDYSFVRQKPNTIRVNATIQQCRTSNYLMILNDGFFGEAYKYIYAFITDVNYINNGTTEITYEIDLIQTYILRCNFGRCWIERNHTDDDDIREHLQPDYMPTTEYYSQSTYRVSFRSWGVVIWTTGHMGATGGVWYDSLFNYGKRYAGSLEPHFFPLFTSVGQTYTIDTQGEQDLLDFLDDLNLNGHLSAVKTISLYPTDLYNNNGHITFTGVTLPGDNYVFTQNAATADAKTFTPDNKRMYSYPYNYLSLTATGGQSINYKYEKMNDTTLHIIGAMSPDATITAFIGAFNAAASYTEVYNQFNSVSIGQIPTISLNVDCFYDWLANNAYGLINNIIGIGAQTASGNALGAIGSTLNTAQTVNQIALNNMKVLSTAAGTSEFSIGNVGFVLQQNHIDLNGLRTADAYFNKYGYAINNIRVPQFNNRPHWTYIKTRDAIVYGNNGYNVNMQIANILNNGITFWKNGDNIGNYTLDNKPA